MDTRARHYQPFRLMRRGILRRPLRSRYLFHWPTAAAAAAAAAAAGDGDVGGDVGAAVVAAASAAVDTAVAPDPAKTNPPNRRISSRVNISRRGDS
jgi:hypothetical protein